MKEDQLARALAACARIMRPLVRLALAFGLKLPHLQELLCDLLLDEARKSWQAKGVEPNLSQLSVTTGLNRKAVTSRVRAVKDALAPSEMSSASKALTLWLQMATDDVSMRSLPITAQDKRPCFESIAWLSSRGNHHHRAILDELVRLDLVIEHDGRVELKADGFIPTKDLQSMLSYLGDNARDHLQAAVSNTLGTGTPMLERAVYAQGLSLADCEAIHQLVRNRWGALHHELAHEMRTAVDRGTEAATGRIRVGIYTYYEDLESSPTSVPPTENRDPRP